MFFDSLQLEFFYQLLLAALFGGLIGLEREYKRKEAGLRTFALVSLGACFFTLISFYFEQYRDFFPSFVQIDPIRAIQAIAIGIGFIGSGLIIYRKFQVEGLTTAAALWAAAAVGIGVGARLYFLSLLSTFLIIIILAGFKFLEQKFFSSKE